MKPPGVVAPAAIGLVLVSGCAHRPPISEPSLRPPAAAIAADRILLAGFVAAPATEDGRRFDVSSETVRYLRPVLDDVSNARVLNTIPMELPASRDGVPIFNNVHFWKIIGEEYDRPLIVTGTVRLTRLAPLPEERLAGRRTIRIWLPAVTLAMDLVLIDGRTGELIQVRHLPTLTQRGKTVGETTLTLYYDAMRRLVPRVAEVFGSGAGRR